MSNIRRITTGGFAKLDLLSSFGQVPRLEWISIARLVVDLEYQRDISSLGRKNIRQIAEHFNWSMFAPVIVASIGGDEYAIVDGQHRTTAAALCGMERVPCSIIAAQRGEQAAAFGAINGNTTRPHTIQMFHAAVAAGDADANRLVAVCAKAGITVPRSLGALRDRQTYSVGTIAKGLRRHGDVIVALALRAIVHSGDGRSEELNRSIIDAVIEVLAANAEWRLNERRLMLAFEDLNLEEMWRDACATAARVRGCSTKEVLHASLTKSLTKSLLRRA